MSSSPLNIPHRHSAGIVTSVYTNGQKGPNLNSTTLRFWAFLDSVRCGECKERLHELVTLYIKPTISTYFFFWGGGGCNTPLAFRLDAELKSFAAICKYNSGSDYYNPVHFSQFHCLLLLDLKFPGNSFKMYLLKSPQPDTLSWGLGVLVTRGHVNALPFSSASASAPHPTRCH